MSACSLLTISGGARRIVFGPQPSNSTPRSNARSTMQIALCSRPVSAPSCRSRSRCRSSVRGRAHRPPAQPSRGHSAIRSMMCLPTTSAFFTPSRSSTSSVASAAAIAHRVSAERRGMRSRNPVHDLGLRHGHAQRHAAGNSLGHADDVGLHAGVLNRPPLAGAAHARLHFVRHQQNPVTVANLAAAPA